MSRPSTASAPSLRPRRGSATALTVVDPVAPERFAVFESKLRIPVVRAGIVSRPGLVNRLRAERSARLTTVVAPQGYGKTTLLAQWAVREERPFAWVSVDERDNDPVVLLRHLAAALARIEPLDTSVLDALAGAGPAVWTDVAPRLAAAIAGFQTPFVIVLDGADALRRGDAADVVSALVEHVPEGSMLVLAGRTQPPLAIARHRASGHLLELRAEELALSRREGVLLLRACGLELTDADAEELAVRAEGWPAGLYLATLALTEGGHAGPVDGVRGDDRYLADYLWSEQLSRLTPERLAFLRRTSVLERLSGDLCDALLEREDSAAELEAIERAGMLLVPLDRRRERYRYHRLFRDVLRHELQQHEPGLLPVLHRRAADWLEAHDEPEAALDHAQASGDADRAARILTTIALPGRGTRPEAVERWLEDFEARTSLAGHPSVAALGAWVHALRGRPDDAAHWLDAAHGADTAGALPDGSRSARPWLALGRAALCADGVERMRQDAADAVAGLPAESPWRPTALALNGVAYALTGEPGDAEEHFLAATDAAERVGDTDTLVLVTAQRALLASAAGDQSTAERLALESRELTDSSEEHVGGALAHATAARVFLRHARWEDARRELDAADRLDPRLTHALPWLAVQARAELAAAYVTLRDRDRAAVQLAACERILGLRPGLGSLSAEVTELRRQIDDLRDPGDGHTSGLTGAELRLLPLLATHLSFREIGDRLYVSRNTIKTQAISAYRKLGVSSRSAAIDRAAELGLLETDDPAAREFIRRG